ncbi:MAG: hypothetical protein H0W58_06140 [Acidobacteria bacterium]|jgi:7-cyano-7-deazaguanine synthase in queuosine biosynthesis|nr:hypothetical protein [Acidobacteriota bacterium]
MNIDVQIDETNRRDDGLAQVMVDFPVLELSRILDLPFGSIYSSCGIPDDTTLDLLLVASLCYVIDKNVSRSFATDFWTRDLYVEIPVSELKKWQNVKTDLKQTLDFLTGDNWQISFRKRKEQIFQKPKPKIRRKPLPPVLKEIDAVCLFSGGVDSLIGAINLLENSNFKGIRLIGHYDAPGAKKPQKDLFDKISLNYPQKAELLQIRVSHKPLKAMENTLRSRSFVFIALGLYAARAVSSKTPLYMPENGFIAMNIPLTPSRAGSCSTRTMHPYYLKKVRIVLDKLGIENSIINPLELKTKGECVSDCLNTKLLSSLIVNSVSCSHSSRKQLWIRRGREVKNCGYCIPCLIRRAAFHKVGFDKAATYGIDVCSGEIKYDDKTNSANDFRAMIDALKSGKTTADFQRDILAVASVERLEERAQMIERGLNEVKSLIQDKADKNVMWAINLPAEKK